MNPRHGRLLRALCHDVSIATAEQAGAIMDLAAPGPAALDRELAALVARDLLRRDRVLARILSLPPAPVACGRPGDPLPDFAPLVAALERRWALAPQVVTVYRAGPKARRVYGSGGGGGQNLAAIGHDIACTELYLAFAAHHPHRLAHWVGEGRRKPGLASGEKLPDVILAGDDHVPYLVCDLLGMYPRRRLEALHLYCTETLNLPYEFW